MLGCLLASESRVDPPVSAAADRETWLRGIAAVASSLPERLSGAFAPAEAPGDETRIQARLEEWRRLVAGGDWAQLERRLAYDGLNLETVHRALGTVEFASGQPLPAWAQTLAQIADWGLRVAELEILKTEICAAGSPIPFEDLLLPCVAHARQGLRSLAGGHYAQLPPSCRAALERGLLHQLSYTAAPTFGLNFPAFETLAKDEEAAPNRQYRAFVLHHLEDRYRELFSNYSVLARLLAEQTGLWIAATAEFLARLQADWPEINARWPLQQVAGIQPGLSDPHHGGRQALIVTFDQGLKLVYKPRDLGMEAAFDDLLRWLDARGLSPTLKPLTVLNRGSHGWMEFAHHAPCQTMAEAQNFYRRAGMLAALIYALRGCDYHSENLIACGQHPVLIDHEMLCQADAPISQPGPARAAALARRDHSVWGNGLLQAWASGAKGQAYDISAIGGVGTRVARRRVWKQINTDRMKSGWEDVHLAAADRENVPFLHGKPLSPGDFTAEIESGFDQMYRFLLAHRQDLLSPAGPLAGFEGLRSRFAFRKTSAYWNLLYASIAPKFLQNGVDRSIQLDRLSRVFLEEAGLLALWPLSGAEQAALSQMDIPHFSAQTGSRALASGGNTLLEDGFPQPAYWLTRAHFEQLSEDDLARQLGFIRLIFASAGQADGLQNSSELPVHPPEHEVETGEMAQWFHRQAVQIGWQLQHYAIQTADEATWLQLETLPGSGAPLLSPLGFDLYAGDPGVAFFLAALSCVEPGGPWRELALKAIRPVLRAITGRQSELHAPQARIGAGVGLGGLVYGLARISRFLGEADILETAFQAAALLTPERIARDQHLDVIGGAAGAILGLLALQAEASPASSPLERAIWCGEHLLRQYPGDARNPQIGFAHGAAGIAYALIELSEASGDPRFREAAEKAFAAETRQLDPGDGGWRGLPQALGKNPDLIGSWCRGAAGIGLARLGGLAALAGDDLKTGAEISLKTVQRFGIQPAGHLCCGALGQVEFLMGAANTLNRPDALETAHRWAAQVARRAALHFSGSSQPESTWPPPELSGYTPGLFKGLAGIGYQFLRLAYPERFPAVLLFA